MKGSKLKRYSVIAILIAAVVGTVMVVMWLKPSNEQPVESSTEIETSTDQSVEEVKGNFSKVTFEGDESHVKVVAGDSGGITTIENVAENSTDGEGSLKVTYGVGDWPGFFIMPGSEGESWDLSGTDNVIAIDVYNESETPVALKAKYDVATLGNGQVFQSNVPQGKSTIYVLDSASGSEVKLGMHTMPPMSGGVLPMTFGWYENEENYNSKEITQITFWILGNTEECTLYFDNMRLASNPYTDIEAAYSNVLDKYGQYTAREWDNKITSDEELSAAKESEETKLSEMIASNSTDRTQYGGWKNEEFKQEATGRFEVAKVKDQWTLIDPEGYPYFATGVDIMRTDDMRTWVSQREFMFEELPEKDGDFAEHYFDVGYTVNPPFGQASAEKGLFNFYTANLQRKYGSDWLNQWANNSMDRFKAWGMTSLGCWSDPSLFYGMDAKTYENKIPYAAHAWAHEDGNESTNYQELTVGIRKIADPFDPYFEESLRVAVQATADAGVKEDPYCMGIYVDNEIGWGSEFVTSTDHYAAVADAISKDSAACYAKAGLIEKLKEKYSSIDELNTAWGSSFADFEALNAGYTGTIPEEDQSFMLSAIADKYYSTVDKVLNDIMPDVLYLGSRLAEWGTSDEIAESAAKYVDVLSYNCYKIDVNQSFINNTLDVPLIIGEFHFTASDEGFFAPGLVPVADTDARGSAYETYANSALTNPNFVGVHWFQYYDQPVLGRAWDGENTNTGFVDVTDQPYDALVDSARNVNNSMYITKFTNVLAKDITVDFTEVTLTAEETSKQINAQVLPEDANNKDILYKSDNEGVAIVSETGIIEAVASGEASISVSSKGTPSVVKTISVTVEGVGEESTSNFAKISFEDGEDGFVVVGTKASNEFVTDQGVTDGERALKVTMTERSNNWGDLSRLDLNCKDGTWDLGNKKEIHATITNPNSEPVQIRVNIGDGTNLRTLYYAFAAEEQKELVIDADELGTVGAADDNWGATAGWYGNGVDTSAISFIQVYFPEPDDSGVVLPSAPLSFIVDNVY